MVRSGEEFLVLVISTICFGASIGNGKTAVRVLSGKNLWNKTKETGVNLRSWVPLGNPGLFNPPGYYNYHGTHQNPADKSYSPFLRNTKKSDLPEKGQIKFMRTLLGKVKTLLNDSKSKKESSSGHDEKKALTDKISSVTSSNNDKLYGVLGDNGDDKDKESEKSVNVISIPLNALRKISKSEPSDSDKDTVTKTSLDSLDTQQQRPQLVLRPYPVRSEDDENRESIPLRSENTNQLSQFVPVMIANPGLFQRDQGAAMMIMNPITRTLQPALRDFTRNTGELGGDLDPSRRFLPKVPLLLERHGDIERKHVSEGGGSLYRDIGHIPEESAKVLEQSSNIEDVGKTSLRHKRPRGNHYSNRYREDDKHESDDDKHESDDDGYDDDDDDYDDDDDDDDDDDNDDDDRKNSERMKAEAREIAATRNRLFSMLPGNDPTYTSEGQGLRMPMAAASQMQLPEAFLGNPMLYGTGFQRNMQGVRNMLPLSGAAIAGEHADNSNERDVFMAGGNQQMKQVFADSSSTRGDQNQMPMPSFNVGHGGFNLGGSQTQAIMSPNEVSYLLEKENFPTRFNEQKNHIARPKLDALHHATTNVLIKVNGQPIGDSKELRNHVVNGRLLRGKEKVIKSKGAMDVKITRATDGVHSKVVDITSSEKVKVLTTKSKIAKTH